VIFVFDIIPQNVYHLSWAFGKGWSWQGAVTHSLNFHPGPPCPTLPRPAGGRPAAVFYPFGQPSPHACLLLPCFRLYIILPCFRLPANRKPEWRASGEFHDQGDDVTNNTTDQHYYLIGTKSKTNHYALRAARLRAADRPAVIWPPFWRIVMTP
jgi:hypothetical protein